MVADSHKPRARVKAKPKAAKKAAVKRQALGRGLAALMPSHLGDSMPSSAQSTGYRLLPIERVQANKKQPRKTFDEAALAELASSIQAQGVLQPIVVRRLGNAYEIVAGERRWRAASRAGMREIPAVIKELSDAHALQVALIENVQRQDLDPLEEAESYGRLIRDHKLSHEHIAAAVGKSRSAITNSLRLLKLPQAVLHMLADGRLTPGHARALMMLEDERQIANLAEDLVGRRASVREAEDKVRRMVAARSKKKGRPSRGGSSAAEASIVERLQQALRTKVRLLQRQGKGRIEIHFHSLDALDGLLDLLLR